jgi:hypothetical protein
VELPSSKVDDGALVGSPVGASWAVPGPGGVVLADAGDVSGRVPAPPPSLLTGKCPFCLAQVQEATPDYCPACGTVHHADCWADAGGCAVVGCVGAPAGASYSPPAAMSYPPPGPASFTPTVPPAPFPAFGSAPVSAANSSRNKLIGAGVAVAVLVLVLVAIAAMAGGAAETHTVTGEISLHGSGSTYLSDGETCSGTGGYSDLDQGTQVTLHNGKGESLANSALESGIYDSSTRACVFSYSLSAVPKDTFYRLEVSHRGVLEYSYAEMQDNGWEIHSTIGP